MSSNRLIYDKCAFISRLTTSVAPLKYNLEGSKFYNCAVNTCPSSAVGAVDRQFIGKRVNMESELRNQTRYNSRCPSRKYIPCDLKDVAYPDFNDGFGCRPLKYKYSYGTCMEQHPSINPFACERHVTLRTNLKMPTYRGFDREKFDSYEHCNGKN
jgi:hypothetical protein